VRAIGIIYCQWETHFVGGSFDVATMGTHYVYILFDVIQRTQIGRRQPVPLLPH
jgi:hypothetical protein